MSIDSSTNINKIFTYQNKHMLIYVETQLISYKDDFINKSNLSVTWIPISSTVVSRNLNYHIDLIQYELYNDEFIFIVKQDQTDNLSLVVNDAINEIDDPEVEFQAEHNIYFKIVEDGTDYGTIALSTHITDRGQFEAKIIK